MNYKQALESAHKTGASKTTGDAELAQTIAALALAHAINPALAYQGAKAEGLTAKQVRKLDPVALGNLMFVDLPMGMSMHD